MLCDHQTLVVTAVMSVEWVPGITLELKDGQYILTWLLAYDAYANFLRATPISATHLSNPIEGGVSVWNLGGINHVLAFQRFFRQLGQFDGNDFAPSMIASKTYTAEAEIPRPQYDQKTVHVYDERRKKMVAHIEQKEVGPVRNNTFYESHYRGSDRDPNLTLQHGYTKVELRLIKAIIGADPKAYVGDLTEDPHFQAALGSYIQHRDEGQLRRGDLIVPYPRGDRNDGVLIWNGVRATDLATDLDEYGMVPKGYAVITEFPTLDYFLRNGITHNNYIWIIPKDFTLIDTPTNMDEKIDAGGDNSEHVVRFDVQSTFGPNIGKPYAFYAMKFDSENTMAPSDFSVSRERAEAWLAANANGVYAQLGELGGKKVVVLPNFYKDA